MAGTKVRVRIDISFNAGVSIFTYQYKKGGIDWFPAVSYTHLDIQPLLEDGGKVRNYSLFPDDENRRFAVYYLELDEGSYWESEPHLKGTTEFITIFTGKIEIYADGQRFIVEKGENIRFKADTVHSYKNVGNESAIMHMILFNP